MPSGPVQVVVLFSGLFSIVRGDLQSKQADVVLVDATKSAMKGLPRHAPRLTVELANVDPKSDRADSVVTVPGKTPEERKTYLVWNLDRVDVRLPGDDGPASLDSVERLQRGRSPGTPDENQDLYWLGHLDRVQPKSKLDRRVLANVPPPIVGSRIRLRQGRLAVENLASTEAGEPVEFPFVRPGEDPKTAAVSQALANVVRWTDGEERAGPVEIKLYPFGSKRPRTVKLKGLQAQAMVTITNEPVSLHGEEMDLIHHWGAFYDLLVKPPSTKNRRLPSLQAAAERGWKNAGTTFCPPSGYP